MQSGREWEISTQFHPGLMGCSPFVTQKATVGTRLWHNPGHCVSHPSSCFWDICQRNGKRSSIASSSVIGVLEIHIWWSFTALAEEEQRLLIRCYLPQVLGIAIGGTQSPVLGVEWNWSCKNKSCSSRFGIRICKWWKLAMNTRLLIHRAVEQPCLKHNLRMQQLCVCLPVCLLMPPSWSAVAPEKKPIKDDV